MPRSAVLTAMILACLAVGCSDGPVVDWQEAVTAGQLQQAGLAFRWQNVVPLPDGDELTEVWRLDENVYCLTTDNRVIVFDAVTGERRWSRDLGHPDELIFAPAHADRVALPAELGVGTVVRGRSTAVEEYDLVIFNTVSYALVYERGSGELLTRIDFTRAGFAANTGSACDGERIYVGSITGVFHAIELVSGLTVWKGRTDAILSANPVVMSGNLYVASGGGGVYAVRIGSESGRRLWPASDEAKQAGGAFAGDIHVGERGIFAGNTDYSVYAIDPVTGRVVWRSRCGGPIRQAVQVGESNVYALAAGDRFYAIDLPTGRIKWDRPDAALVVAEIGPTAFAVNADNELMAVDAAGGEVSTVVPMTGLDLFAPNTSAPAIYAAGRGGLLCCIQPIERADRPALR